MVRQGARLVCTEALRVFRALHRFGSNMLDRAQQEYFDRVYARRMAVRRMFLRDPRNVNSEFTADGRRVLGHLARHCHALAPVQSSDPIIIAKAEGKREAFALLLADLFDDLPDFARAMAEKEEEFA